MDEQRKKLLKVYAKTTEPEELFVDTIEKIEKVEQKIKDIKIPEAINGIIPVKGKDYFDGESGKTPTDEEIIALIKPFIPPAIPGKDGSIITPEEVRDKLKELKGKDRLSVFDLKDIEFIKGKNGEHIQWSPAGFKIFTDSTLTGDGSNSNPLHAIVPTPDLSAYLKLDQTTPQTVIGTPEFPDLKITDQQLGTPTYKTIGDYFDTVQSSGRINGMALSAGTNTGTMKVGVGQGMIKTSNVYNAPIKFFDLSEVDNIACTDKALNYLYVDYNSGSPTVKATTDRTTIHDYDHFTIGRVYREGSDMGDITKSGTNIYNEYRRIHNRLVKRYGFCWASGSTLAEAGTRGLSVTSGVWYIGNTEINTAVHNTISGTGYPYGFDLYYYNPTSAAWVVSTGNTTLGNSRYNNTVTGTGLTTMTGNKYANYWVYICPAGDLYVLYGQQEYTSLALAQATQAPALLPNYISSNTRLIARITFKNGDTNFAAISNALITPISATSVSNHNNLGGLQGGTTGEYYHLTNTEYGGDWGVKNITTTGDINADSGFKYGGNLILQCPSYNFFGGIGAGIDIANSDNNVFIGNGAGANSDGSYYETGVNVAIGEQAFNGASGSVVVAIGPYAGQGAYIVQSVLIGQNAGAFSGLDGSADSVLAVGSNAFGTGSYSQGGVVIGACNQMHGDYSVVVGQGDGTVYTLTTVVGSQNEADGDHDIIIGTENRAMGGDYEFIFGTGNQALHVRSMLLGENLTSSSENEIQLGLYNGFASANQVYLKMTADSGGSYIHYNFPYMAVGAGSPPSGSVSGDIWSDSYDGYHLKWIP